jgi:hypothetical protein
MLPDPRDSISISKAAARVGVSTATLKRWALKGAALSDGSRLKLRAIRLPSGFRFTEAWVEEFVSVLTKDRLGQPAESAVDVERADRADRVLQASGW